MATMPMAYLKKLAAVEILAEKNDNFDILDILNHLVYVSDSDAIAYTDGKRIFVADKLFEMTPQEIYFVINHEFDHIYFRHFNRFADKMTFKHYVTNIATDCIINEMLANEGLKQPEGTITRADLGREMGKTLRGRTSEEVYREIIDWFDEQEQKQEQKSDQGEDEDGHDQGSSESDSEVNSDRDSNIEKELDKILGSGKGRAYKEDIDAQARSVKQSSSDDKELSEEDKEIIEKIKEKVEAKRRSIAGRAKNELFRNITPAKVDWRKELMKFLGRHLKRAEARNPNRPSYRYNHILGRKVIIPSNQGYVLTPKINVYLDISGSMSGTIINNVRSMLAEAQRHLKKYKGSYYEFNTEIYELTRKDFYTSTNISGGTDIKKVLRHYKQDTKADLGILITDAEDEFETELAEINKSTLIITNNKGLKTANPKVTIVTTDFT